MARDLAERDLAKAQAPSTEAALFIGERALQQHEDLVVGQKPQAMHDETRLQRRHEREARILRRRADQGHVPPLDAGQERVLLRLVEAMDLVD
nr:hypothetical protein [Planctomycetota bacterium]